MTVYAIDKYASNAELIIACHTLGYLQAQWLTLDPTYGQGTFWNLWKPYELACHDLKLDGVDFRSLPYGDNHFDAVVFDPPYKLNGTPTPEVDARYGVDVVQTIAQRHQLIFDGIDECVRVLMPRGFLLIKAMDQVSSGKVQWQTRLFADRAEHRGTHLIDMLHIVGSREQPKGRRQVHARRNYSTMLILQKGKR